MSGIDPQVCKSCRCGRSTVKIKFLVLLWSLCLLTPAFALQDDEEDALDSFGESKKAAYLNVSYDERGGTTISLSLASQPQSWNGIQAALAQVFNCASGSVNHPDSVALSSRYLNRISPAERQKQLKILEKQDALELEGHCSGSAHRSGLVFHTTIATNNLLHQLQEAGITELHLWI